jgi:hypothetical protein
MASREQNITIDIGADFSANVVAYANGSVATSLDLSTLNYTANAQIRKSYLHYANVAAIFNVWIQDASSGIINIHLNSANTVLMKSGKYVYDVMVNQASGPGSPRKTRVVEGIATVTSGVAR